MAQRILALSILLLLVGCAGGPTARERGAEAVDRYDFWTAGETRLRGFMVGTEATEADLDDLRAWNVNLIRLQIRQRAHLGEVFAEVFPRHLADAERIVAGCAPRGIGVVIDYHAPADRNAALWSDPAEHDALVARWEELARRFRDAPNVLGYDLLNEPVHPSFPPLAPWPETGTDSWPALVRRTIRAIRALDPRTPIVVEPGPAGGMPMGFRVFPPLADERLVLSFHMYQPHEITYQGIRERRTDIVRPMPRHYPGMLDGVRVDNSWLAQDMRPALDYSRRHKTPIFVGEFSCVRWAPGDTAVNYLRDAIDLFEQYGWNWTYHAFREWPGWSLEHVGGPEEHVRATEPTDRLLLIRSYLERNESLRF